MAEATGEDAQASDVVQEPTDPTPDVVIYHLRTINWSKLRQKKLLEILNVLENAVDEVQDELSSRSSY